MKDPAIISNSRVLSDASVSVLILPQHRGNYFNHTPDEFPQRRAALQDCIYDIYIAIIDLCKLTSNSFFLKDIITKKSQVGNTWVILA